MSVAKTMTVEAMEKINAEATASADQAVSKFLEKYGEPMYCGFAWVNVKARSNSKLGKALQKVGFSKSWESGVLYKWSPSSYFGQSMDIKEEAAMAYVKVLSGYGIDAWYESRAD